MVSLTLQCFHDSGVGLIRLSTQQHSNDVAAAKESIQFNDLWISIIIIMSPTCPTDCGPVWLSKTELIMLSRKREIKIQVHGVRPYGTDMHTIKIIIEMPLLVLSHENCIHSAEFTCDGG